MRNGPDDGPSHRIATARTEKAHATFQRTDPNAATIELTYEIKKLEADLSATSLKDGIQAICEKEIEEMRRELTQLAGQLTSQLSNAGEEIKVTRKWHDKDKRTWKDTRWAFYVKGSSYHSRETLSIPANAADAALVRAVIQSTIEQREQNIRNTYATILANAVMKRTS